MPDIVDAVLDDPPKQPDIIDTVLDSSSNKTPGSPTPEIDKAVATTAGATTSKIIGELAKPAHSLIETGKGMVTGIPEFIKMASDPWSPETLRKTLLGGVQVAAQIEQVKKSEPLSQEWWDAVVPLTAQAAMEFGGLRGVAPKPAEVLKPEAPPVQVAGEAPVVPELPKQQIGGDLIEEVQKGGMETQGTGQEETSTISSPLASTAEPAAVSGPASPAAAEPPSGISNERLQQIYGEDAITAGKGLGAQEWQRIGQADTRDPYAAMSAAQARGIASPKDVALFRAEHQRLLNTARNAYGTPQYGELAQNSADMANAIKRVAHGPASDVFRALQDVDVPRYDSPADFDSIVRERMNRESTPDEHATFQKISGELRNGDQEVIRAASEAQNNLRRYRPNEVMSFDDAVNHIKDQIKSITTDCNL